MESYKPPSDSLLQISFSYPVDWEFGQRKMSLDIEIMGLVDPTSPKVTASTLSRVEPIPDVGMLEIRAIRDIEHIPSDMVMERSINSLVHSIASNPLKLILEERQLEIDGHNAYWIISNWKPGSWSRNQEEALIVEDVFILDEDRYYWIALVIPESERTGKFGQGFDHLVASIKFVR
jgi:hypothetical protein